MSAQTGTGAITQVRNGMPAEERTVAGVAVGGILPGGVVGYAGLDSLMSSNPLTISDAATRRDALAVCRGKSALQQRLRPLRSRSRPCKPCRVGATASTTR